MLGLIVALASAVCELKMRLDHIGHILEHQRRPLLPLLAAAGIQIDGLSRFHRLIDFLIGDLALHFIATNIGKFDLIKHPNFIHYPAAVSYTHLCTQNHPLRPTPHTTHHH